MEAGRAIPATERNWQHPDLRSWLQRLVATDRLVVAREGISLIDELAAVAKKLELENAVGRLRHYDNEIGSISQELGFSAQSNFTRFFQQHTGTSPNQYRRVMADVD